MRYSGLGQNFVQAGPNGGGGQSRIGAMIANYYGMRSRAELITHQTNESIRRDEANYRAKTIYGAAGDAIKGHIGREGIKQDYEDASERYQDKNHPDIGKKITGQENGTPIYAQVGDFVRPQLQAAVANQGYIKPPSSGNTQLGSTAGANAAQIKADADAERARLAREKGEQLPTNTTTTNIPPDNNNNTPPPTDNTPNNNGGAEPRKKTFYDERLKKDRPYNTSGNASVAEVRSGVKSGNISEEEGADLLNVNSRQNEFKNGGNK